MSTSLRIEPRGLYSNPSAIKAPPGAMSVATNVVIDRPGVIQSRRGYTKISDPVTSFFSRLFEYDSELIGHYGNATLAHYNGTIWTNYAGTFAAFSTLFKLQFAVAKQNLYFTTDAGLYRLSKHTGIAEQAGQFRVPGFDRTNSVIVDTSATLGPNWLATGKDVAYRALVFKKDGYDAPIIGPPSGRFIFTNPSGGSTRSVTVRIYLPREIQNSSSTAANYYDGYFLQLYRSAQVDTGTTPSDELQQVYEVAVTSTNVTNGYVEVTDVCPDELRQGFLYTNPATGKSIADANEPPPKGACMATWKDRLWVGNFTGPHRFTFQLIAVLGVGGVQDTDTITLGGVTYTGTTGAVSANKYALVASGAGVSVSQSIERTAMNLVEAINKSASNTTYYAEYSAKPDDPLSIGRITMIARTPTTSGFDPNVGGGSKTECWQPVLPATTPDTDLGSTQVSLPNGVCWSKPKQPDAFPLGHQLRLGAQEKMVLRMIPLRDRLWVFKEDGVFVITGDDESNFSAQLWDPTINLFNPDVAVTLANEIYLLSTQGVVSVSEAGPALRSGAIQKTLLDLIAPDSTVPGYGSMYTNCYAVAYESDHKFILGVPAGPSGLDAVPRTMYVLNVETGCWTSWSLAGTRSYGYVRPSEDRLYWSENNGAGVNAYVHKERKARTSADYIEYDSSAISKTITFEVEDGGAPAQMKQFSEAELLFLVEPASAVGIAFASERGSASATSVTSKSNLSRRTLVPLAVSRASRLSVTITHAVASESFDLAGVALKYRLYGGKTGR